MLYQIYEGNYTTEVEADTLQEALEIAWEEFTNRGDEMEEWEDNDETCTYSICIEDEINDTEDWYENLNRFQFFSLRDGSKTLEDYFYLRT